MRGWSVILSLATAVAISGAAFGQPLAFPGAEGAGKFAVGGRGGDVYRVTNLNDAGPGSLRYGVDTQAGPRTIVFDVGGNIELQSGIAIDKNYLTIAGQTAPGGGITLKGAHLQVQGYYNDPSDIQSGVIYTHDVVIRHLRFRPGDINTAPDVYEPDSLTIVRAKNVMVDHVSTSWSTDELLSVTISDDVTVQWSMITEALHNSNHAKGNHGYGSIISGGDITFHHNLYASNRSRHPRPQGNNPSLPTTRMDFVNNVIYNPQQRYGYGGSDDNMQLNFEGNYGISGPNTNSGNRTLFHGASSGTQVYQSGNLMDLNENGVLDGNNDGWSDFSGTYTQSASRFGVVPINAESAGDALASVLGKAGPARYRDLVDARLVSDVQSYGGAGDLIDSQNEVGGWPDLPDGLRLKDTDQDGMPDVYERTLSHLNPTNPGDGTLDANGNGYTDLEDYLNWKVSSHELAPVVNFRLRVNRTTGAMELENASGDEISLMGYSIHSSVGSLVHDQWLSIAENYDTSVPVGERIDVDDHWEVQTLASDYYRLAESHQDGGNGAQLAAGAAITLSEGGAWIPTVVEDVYLEVLLPGGVVTPAQVVYEGSGPVSILDLHVDGVVDHRDWQLFLAKHLSDMSGLSEAQSRQLGDLDGDGDNDGVDFMLFRQTYLAEFGPEAFAAMIAVPEPASALLVLLVVSAGAVARRPW